MGCLEIGVSLVFLMGFSFLASVTLLVLSSPLRLIFIPLLFFTGFVFVGAMTGFAMARAMALTGMSTLGWIFQEPGGTCLLGFGGVAERLKEQFSIGNVDKGADLKANHEQSKDAFDTVLFVSLFSVDFITLSLTILFVSGILPNRIEEGEGPLMPCFSSFDLTL
ncbi:hypothetical protein GBA52_007870 [Prunus armeniaca]|nr:hypothetical protein GBA52_007870 [Prunus armeniaca]